MKLEVTFALLPVAGVLLSLAGFYLPYFNGWYAKKSPEGKQLVMLGLMALVSLATVGLSMLGVVSVYSADIKLAWWPALVDFGAAVVANATTYKSTDKINDALKRRSSRRKNRLDSAGKHG